MLRADARGGPGEAAPRIASVVLAAGAGERFGGRKQLARLGDRPLLEHALAAAARAPSDEVVLVLGAEAAAIEDGVEVGDATVVRCLDWERGPGASLRAGLATLADDVGAALVTLGDEPFVPPAATRRLLAGRRRGLAALRAGYRGRPGHPVLIERSLFPALTAAADSRPEAILREAGIEIVACDDLGDPADVDTPEQLAALEAEIRRDRPTG